MIYIVEDDRDIREMETYALKTSGFEVCAFENGRELFEALSKKLPQIILLDIMLPGEDGLNILRKLRGSSQTKDVAVILVTAKNSEIDKVKGLDLGADDYIVKPFGIMEFVSRVKAILRRCAPSSDNIIVYGDIEINDYKHTVSIAGKPCVLTYKEFELLKYLAANSGLALSRETLLDKVWGFGYEGETRTVDMHIKTLRQKLGERGGLIKTIRNVGYKFGE